MCHELMYLKRAATKETRKSEPQQVKEPAPPRSKVEEDRKQVPEPA